MKSLKISKNTVGLRVYCSKCDKLYNYDTITRCPHGKTYQKYKSIVYRGNGTKSTRHNTEVYEDALLLAIQYKKDVKNGVFDYVETATKEVDPRSITVLDAANLFMNYKHGINVAPHLRVELSKDYLKSIELYLRQFLEVLKEHRVNPGMLPMVKVGIEHVGWWYEMVEKRYSPGSRNAPLRIMRLWVKFMNKRFNLSLYDPFMDVKLIQTDNTVDVISETEFITLCNSIGVVNPYEQLHGKTSKRKNRYKPYLVEAFRLALYTGLRREELLSLTWDSIHKVEGRTEDVIITNNLKVERIFGRKYRKKYVPVHDELREFLIELGMESKLGSSEYIICPSRKANINTMMRYITKGFTHYYKECFPDKPHKTFGVLRKTYLTQLQREVGDGVAQLSSHSSKEVLEKHYFDMKLISKGLKVKMFSRK